MGKRPLARDGCFMSGLGGTDSGCPAPRPAGQAL